MMKTLLPIMLLAFPLCCSAQVSVDQAIVNFKSGDKPIHNAIVTNNGDEPLYINAQVDRVVHPGEKDEARETTEELLASPKRFSLEPHAQRTVRLLLKTPATDSEQVYRISLLPQANEFDTAEAKKSGGKSMQLKVLFSVGMLILADPAEAAPKLVWERTGDKFIFKNEGNVNVFLGDIKHCSAPDTDCEEISANRLYPGNSWELKIPAQHLISFRKEISTGSDNITVLPGDSSKG